jgi:hypothetical protein
MNMRFTIICIAVLIVDTFSVRSQESEYQRNKNFYMGVGLGLNYQNPKEINHFLDNYFEYTAYEDENYHLGPSLDINLSSVYFIKSNYFIQTCVNGILANKILEDDSPDTEDPDWAYTRLGTEMSFNLQKLIGDVSIYMGAGPTFQFIRFDGPYNAFVGRDKFRARGIALLVQAGTGFWFGDDFMQFKFQTDFVNLSASMVDPDINSLPLIARFKYPIYSFIMSRNF